MRRVNLAFLVLNTFFVGYSVDRGDWGWVAFNGTGATLVLLALLVDEPRPQRYRLGARVQREPGQWAS